MLIIQIRLGAVQTRFSTKKEQVAKGDTLPAPECDVRVTLGLEGHVVVRADGVLIAT